MMIMKRSAVAAAAALTMTLSFPAAAEASEHPAAPAAAVPQVLPIGVAVSALPLAVEDRTGYQRTSFRHWNAGDVPADGCNARAEVLLAEAVVYPYIRGALAGWVPRMLGVHVHRLVSGSAEVARLVGAVADAAELTVVSGDDETARAELHTAAARALEGRR
ncbi:hypothetical protein [Streptomyces sp. IGB124]|nr:hypothetical protein [Streptomyces sp. IGB124]